jgi:NAD-dependent deacetylase
VYPAAGLPDLTLRSGGAVVEVNLDPTPLTGSATVSIRGQAGEILPEIVGA